MNNTKTGILISSSFGKIVGLLPLIQRDIIQTLYITLYPYEENSKNSSTSPFFSPQISSKIISTYAKAASFCRNIDVRIMLEKFQNKNQWEVCTKKTIDIVYFDQVIKEDIKKCIMNKSENYKTVYLDSSNMNESSCDLSSVSSTCTGIPNTIYTHSVLGGTFDRLHAGHKILLSEAVLRSSRKVTVGVTDGPMLYTKKLFELIQPCEYRKQNVLEFLQDIDSSLEYDVVSITDMYGPTKDDPNFENLIVSAETQGGGDKVNELRIANNLKPMDVVSVPLLPSEEKVDEVEEDKVSSSNLRMRELGCLRKPVQPRPNLKPYPYLIGLTGGIASGKSTIGKYLESKGAGLINCDLLGHQAYDVGTAGNAAVRQLFGEDIALPDGTIDRRKLGAIVFANKTELTKLNQAIWPLILAQVKEEIVNLSSSHKIIIIEAAVLLPAKWYDQVHEIWVSFIPEKEAIKRIQERNGLSEADAKLRLSSQPPNSEYVSSAHVLLSSTWDVSHTRRQVDRAYRELQDRLPAVRDQSGIPSGKL
uniref:Bifunctional coenzyme A synthase n=1 Tax=Cacopsylla melanoneura TaxID=428564 RepID=A0A8D8S0P4_9HEMI